MKKNSFIRWVDFSFLQVDLFDDGLCLGMKRIFFDGFDLFSLSNSQRIG